MHRNGKAVIDISKNIPTNHAQIAMDTNGEIVVDMIGSLAQIFQFMQLQFLILAWVLISTDYVGPLFAMGISCIAISALLTIVRVFLYCVQRD